MITRMMYDSDWKQGIVRLIPQGWTTHLAFVPNKPCGCGVTRHGLSISIGDSHHGVLTVDDLLQLRDMINEHLENVTSSRGHYLEDF